ncbi:NUDIX hydrolase [Pectinatus sottacetonis]|uniref:NUDIX hydrolase n=1 Tax=Pectinatus sottacetonis TaxID=1002795 RepID=UPI0018C61FE2|nr:CoA pyrophosphatase [Pectinatus sottacetonis]
MQDNTLNNFKKHLPPFPGIQGKDEYMNAAVLVLLLPINNEYHLLLQKRSPHISQGGEICFPGGKYDPRQDTSLQHTALRETSEELGVCSDKISIIGQADTLILPIGKIINIFIGTADYMLKDLKINNDEVERAFTLPISYFKNNPPSEYSVLVKNHPSYFNNKNQLVELLPTKELGLPSQYEKPWGNLRHHIYVYKTYEGIIWGLTARIIRDVCTKFYQ